MKENLMETFKQGLFLGMLLFICSLTALRLAAPEGVGPVWSLFPAVLSGYLAAGCFLQLIRSLAARLDSAFFRGAAAAAWCYIVLFCLFFPAQNLPLPVRIMLLTSAAVLLLLWEAEYRYLKSVARDLNSGAATGTSNISIDDQEIYKVSEGEDLTTNLAEGKDGKTHYAVLNVSLVLNKKSDNYKKYTQDFLTNQDDTIKNDIIKVVSGYTFEQFNQNSDAIKDTILEDMQNLFGKDYVIGVNFSKLTAQ